MSPSSKELDLEKKEKQVLLLAGKCHMQPVEGEQQMTFSKSTQPCL